MEVSHATQPVLLTGLILPIFGHGQGVYSGSIGFTCPPNGVACKEINTSKQLLEVLAEFIIFFLVKCSGMHGRKITKMQIHYSVRISNFIL